MLEKTLESPLDCKEIKVVNSKGNQSWIFIGRTDVKLQYFGHLMQRTDCLEKILILGKFEGRTKRDGRGWDGWMASPTRWTWVWVNSGSWWWTGRPGVLRFMGSQQLSDWTELNNYLSILMAISFEYFLDMELLGQIFCKTLRLLACIAYPESAPNCTPVSGRYMSIPLSGILADVIMFLKFLQLWYPFPFSI